VASHPAESLRLRPNIETGLTPQDILAKTAKEYQRGVELLQFSLTGEDGSYVLKTCPSSISNRPFLSPSGRELTTKLSRLIPRKNGFVDTVITAYNAHHALVIRPDDVWLAILSQFNLYVNSHPELLRKGSLIVGYRTLVNFRNKARVETPFGNRVSNNFSSLI
jgi:hypothetical protein